MNTNLGPHVHNAFICPAHITGCSCDPKSTTMCNPYHIAGFCPSDINEIGELLKASTARVQQAAGLSPEYAKFITAIVGQGLTFASLYYGNNLWVAVAVAAASALGVRAVPNRQGIAPPMPTQLGGTA